MRNSRSSICIQRLTCEFRVVLSRGRSECRPCVPVSGVKYEILHSAISYNDTSYLNSSYYTQGGGKCWNLAVEVPLFALMRTRKNKKQLFEF